jgi:hypothetical protein
MTETMRGLFLYLQTASTAVGEEYVMTTIDQTSDSTRTNPGLHDAIPYRRSGRLISFSGQLGRDRALGDFAAGQRTYPDTPVVRGDFATGVRTMAKSAAIGDFATGMRITPAPACVGDFATGMRTAPVEVPFNDDRVSTLAVAA